MLEPHNILLGGDLNLCLTQGLDKNKQPQISSLNTEGARYRARVKALAQNLHLFDVWRSMNPNRRQYTFRGVQYASRLDYWLMSEHLFDAENKGIH